MLIIDFSIFIKVVFSGDTSFLSQRIWQRQIPRTAKVVEMQVVMPCYFTIKQVQSSYCQFHSISMATCLSIYIYIYMSSWMERVVRKWYLRRYRGTRNIWIHQFFGKPQGTCGWTCALWWRPIWTARNWLRRPAALMGPAVGAKDFGSTQPVLNKGLLGNSRDSLQNMYPLVN